MDRLVYYSLSVTAAEPRTDLLRQLLTSVQTLREHNRSVPVIVFAYDGAAAAVERALAPYGVEVHHRGEYARRLAELCPEGWTALRHYPLLHKFLNFSALAALRPSQALFLDCDTLFFGDVGELFARYGRAHCYAREEPTCRRSHYGYDPGYLDEERLTELASSLGATALPPFNLGVVLFNHGIWEALASVEPLFVSYAWRLLAWLARHPSAARTAAYGESPAVGALRRQQPGGAPAFGGAGDAAPLPFPSANEWILDQVALWLALGHLEGLACDDFSPRHVLQNGEPLGHAAPQADWILCHYFSQNTSRLEHWLRHWPTAANL